jgi:hypothetical protein
MQLASTDGSTIESLEKRQCRLILIFKDKIKFNIEKYFFFKYTNNTKNKNKQDSILILFEINQDDWLANKSHVKVFFSKALN